MWLGQEQLLLLEVSVSLRPCLYGAHTADGCHAAAPAQCASAAAAAGTPNPELLCSCTVPSVCASDGNLWIDGEEAIVVSPRCFVRSCPAAWSCTFTGECPEDAELCSCTDSAEIHRRNTVITLWFMYDLFRFCLLFSLE